MQKLKDIPLFCEKCGKRIPNREDRRTNICLECTIKNRCPLCGRFLKADGSHTCVNVDLKEDRRCLICGRGLKNVGWERYSKICGPCGKKIQRQKERELRNRLIKQFGGKCKVCRYDKFKECLEFHHTDKSMKKSRCFLKDILKWPDKFELLCNRCHREKEVMENKNRKEEK